MCHIKSKDYNKILKLLRNTHLYFHILTLTERQAYPDKNDRQMDVLYGIAFYNSELGCVSFCHMAIICIEVTKHS